MAPRARARSRALRKKPEPVAAVDRDVPEGEGQDNAGGPEPGPEPEPSRLPPEVVKHAGDALAKRIDSKLARAYRDPDGAGVAEATYDPVARARNGERRATARVQSYQAEEARREQVDRLDREIVRSQMNDLRAEATDADARAQQYGLEAANLRNELSLAHDRRRDLEKRIEELGARLLERDESLAVVRKHYAALLERHTRLQKRRRRR